MSSARGSAPTRWLPWTLFGLSAAATATSVVAFTERERLAARWNSAACIAPGRARGEICADEHDALRTWDGVLLASGIAAGALFGATLFVLHTQGPGASERATSASVGCGVHGASVSCSGSF